MGDFFLRMGLRRGGVGVEIFEGGGLERDIEGVVGCGKVMIYDFWFVVQ